MGPARRWENAGPRRAAEPVFLVSTPCSVTSAGLAPGIDGEVVGAALFTSGQIQALDKVRGTGLHQSDAYRHGTGTRGKMGRQFGHDRFPKT